jgi:hypothetical protein
LRGQSWQYDIPVWCMMFVAAVERCWLANKSPRSPPRRCWHRLWLQRMCPYDWQLLPFLALLVAQVNGSDLIWRSQTRLTSSLRIPCSQQQYPCRIYDVKFCSSHKFLYLGAAAWDDAAHVWSLSGCPLPQNDCDFEMYASSAARREVRTTSFVLQRVPFSSR